MPSQIIYCNGSYKNYISPFILTPKKKGPAAYVYVWSALVTLFCNFPLLCLSLILRSGRGPGFVTGFKQLGQQISFPTWRTISFLMRRARANHGNNGLLSNKFFSMLRVTLEHCYTWLTCRGRFLPYLVTFSHWFFDTLQALQRKNGL